MGKYLPISYGLLFYGNKVGLKSSFRSEGPHAWNMAMLDGKLGYIDVTWDDPVPDRGSVYNNYFNISERQMANDHEWDRDDFSEKYLDY